MSAASCLLSEDQFLCSICLDVFTDPVSIPCGHNFCKSCITEHWKRIKPNFCPNCKEVFNDRPELRVNTLISEMVAQLRHQCKTSSSRSDVPCDFCAATKQKALKTCLMCQASFCETHLEPHLTMAELKKHQLIDPVDDLVSRTCSKHNKLLEMFCKTDQTCVCIMCAILDHKTHNLVLLRDEYEEKKVELQKTEAEIQQMIQRRREKIQEIELSVQLSSDDADSEIAEGVQVFTTLKESIDRGLKEFIKEIEEKQRRRENQAEGFIKELKEEICELEKRSSEVEQLSRSEDHLHLIQNFSSINAVPTTKDLKAFSFRTLSYEGTVVRAVDELEKTLSEQMKKVFEAELKRVQQYAVDVTFDPDTAHPVLILSDDGKQVHTGDIWRNLPDNPERFSLYPCVLGKQDFSTGRFYYEVQVKGKTDWDLGVTRESINRKDEIPASPQNGFWVIGLRKENQYYGVDLPAVCLSLKIRPEKVGVFVDHEEGLVSFYDTNAAALIYSFTGCSFTEKLYPFFNPSINQGGKNSAPLIISPVSHTE